MRLRILIAYLAAAALRFSGPAAAQLPSPPATGTANGAATDSDEVWLTDSTGRRYYVERLEKADATLRLVDKGKVQTNLGLTFDLVREDNRYYYVKVYEPVSTGPGLVREAPPPLGGAPPTAVPTAVPEPPTAPAMAPATSTVPLRFEDFGRGLPSRGQWRNGFDIGDMNGDGHLDIVHGPPRKGSRVPAIFLGDGKGAWTRWKDVKFPAETYDYGDAAVADFNGDKALDLALGVHLRGLLVLAGDGKGGFTTWSQGVPMQRSPTDPPAFSTRAISTVDWNRDGKPDIAALGEGPRPGGQRGQPGEAPGVSTSFGAAILLNGGAGEWTVQRSDEPMQSFGETIAVGDFNGDKQPDLATGSSWLGRRDLVRLGQREGKPTAVTFNELPARLYAWAVAATDWNGDGLDDLAVGSTSIEGETWSSGVHLLYSAKDGRWTHVNVAREPGREGVFAVAGGDFNGDGSRDLIALTGEGRVWVFQGRGDAGMVRLDVPELAEAGQGCRGYHARLVDLDGDGADEIVAGFAGESDASSDQDCASGGALKAWKYIKPQALDVPSPGPSP